MISRRNDITYEFKGLSTDEKPIGSNCSNATVDYPIENGSTFFAINKSSGAVTLSMFVIDEDTLVGSWVDID